MSSDSATSSTPEEVPQEFAELLQVLSNEFDMMCQDRHDMGAEKYGHGTFLTVDTLRMAVEEVVDLANYARYTYIRLRLLQNAISEALGSDSTQVPLADGFASLRRDGKQ